MRIAVAPACASASKTTPRHDGPLRAVRPRGDRATDPHRPPFLLVDEILELEPGKRVLGRRSIRPDDWWFPGHFPGRPVMPGVLTVEAIAQAGAVAVLADPANTGKIPFFAGIDECRFKRVVEPGDVLTLECEFTRVRGPLAKGRGRALVGEEVAAEALLTVFVGG